MTRAATILHPVGVLILAALVFSLESVLAGNPGSGTAAWGLPLFAMIMRLAAIVVLGGLLVSLELGSTSAAMRQRGTAWAAGAGAAWTLASAVTGLLRFIADVPSTVRTSTELEAAFVRYATASAPGVAWVLCTVLAAAVTVICFASRGRIAIGVAVVVAVAGVASMSEQLTTAGRLHHVLAVSGSCVETVGLGCVLGAGIVHPGVRARPISMRAGLVASAVGLAGISAAGLGSVAGLDTSYGFVVLARAVVFVALIVAVGIAWRGTGVAAEAGVGARVRVMVSSLRWVLALGAAIIGLDTALTRITAPGDGPALGLRPGASPAEVLTNEPLPPSLGGAQWIVSWRFDVVWSTVVLLGVLGIVHVVRRGGLPGVRVVPAIVSLVLVAWSTNGAPAVYGQILISMHVVQLLLLLVVVPALLVWARPSDPSVGRPAGGSASRWRSAVLRSPAIATALGLAALWSLFDSAATGWMLRNWMVAVVAMLAVLAVGWLLLSTLMRVRTHSGAAMPRRSRISRIVCGLLVGASCAALGVLYLGPLGLVEASWFGATGRTWGATPMADQRAAGIVLIVVGVLLAAGVVVRQTVGGARAARVERIDGRGAEGARAEDRTVTP